jgi:hypothetical protein
MHNVRVVPSLKIERDKAVPIGTALLVQLLDAARTAAK